MERLRQRTMDLFRDTQGVTDVLDTRQQNDELVAADALRCPTRARSRACDGATACSTRSPIWWPNPSLTGLKLLAHALLTLLNVASVLLGTRLARRQH